MTTDNRTNEEERLMECEHLMVSDDFGEGLVYEWCIGCDHEEINYV